MKGKLAVLAGVGVGYVLGTRAGRERYEQISDAARRLWEDPRVAQKRQQAADLARDQAVAAKDAAKDAVAEKMHKSSDDSGSTQSVSANDLPDAPSYPV
jgi:SLT domain-containing protein